MIKEERCGGKMENKTDRQRIIWPALHDIDFKKLKELWDDPSKIKGEPKMIQGAPRGTQVGYAFALHPDDIYVIPHGILPVKNDSFDLHLEEAVGGIGYNSVLENGLCFKSYAPLENSKRNEEGLYSILKNNGGSLAASLFPVLVQQYADSYNAEVRWELFTTQAFQALRRSVQFEKLISDAGTFGVYSALEKQIIYNKHK